jgi:CMP/dCMP kinase
LGKLGLTSQVTLATMTRSSVIAIDGPAGAGKSTVAKLLAQRLKCTLLDTGAIYRVVALAGNQRGIDWHDGPALGELASQLKITFRWADGINQVLLDEQDVTQQIRTPEISRGASQVSSLPQVRDALLALQREFARTGTVVAEGRDIGTVVFPQARVKVFLSADPRVRARRRHQELVQGGHTISQAEVLQEQQSRDAADSGRLVAPLRAATDATIIDTSGLSVEQVVEQLLELFQRS